MSRPPSAAPYLGDQRRQPGVSFVNLTNAPLTIRGPVTGIEYRFERPGARVEIDPRDRVLLASLRQLRQVG